MSGYDRGWQRPYDWGFGRGHLGYGASDFGGWWGGPEASWGPPPPFRQPPRPSRPAHGYDRGVYGEYYPAYGGYPGDDTRGAVYGGYDRSYRQPVRYPSRDYGGGPSYGDYSRGNAGGPFLPEFAYQRHPELDRPHRVERSWSRPAGVGVDLDLDDDEIEDAVRLSLFNDDWIDSDRIQVEVNDQVVTLTGEVDDYMEARYAWDDAWEAHGVRGVINQLTVRMDDAPASDDKATKSPSQRKPKAR